MPQIAVGVEHKRNSDTPVALAVGAAHGKGTDFTLSATKLFLSHSVLVNTTARLTKANQGGLLGFGSPSDIDYSLQFEGSVAYQLSRRAVIGAEYRTKPDNLAIAREDDWWDLFAAYAVTKNLTIAIDNIAGNAELCGEDILIERISFAQPERGPDIACVEVLARVTDLDPIKQPDREPIARPAISTMRRAP